MERKKHWAWRHYVAAASIGLVVSCRNRGVEAPKPTPCAVPVKVAVTGGNRINPDDDGQPLPTVVRLYQTSKASPIEDSDFEPLWTDPASVLGDVLVDQQEITLFPDRPVTVDTVLDPGSRYFLAVGIFRKPKGKQWRQYLALPRSETLCQAYGESPAPEPAVTVSLDGYRIEVDSRLLDPGGGEALPEDVAPRKKSDKKTRKKRDRKARNVDVSGAPSSTPSEPSAPSGPSAPSAPSEPSAPSGPSAPSASSF